MNARIAALILVAGLGAAALTGCATNAITGDSSRHEQVYRGDVGISGDGHHVDVLAGSEVAKLSIVGEDNEVFIQDGATVEKIEIVGDDNKVDCPPDLTFKYSEIGEDNRITYRR